MAERNTKWQKIERKDSVQEYFCLGEFIQSDQWNISSHPVFQKKVYEDGIGYNVEIDYPYLKDGFRYGRDCYTYDNEIHVTEMTHATSFECMRSIIDEGGFRSEEKCFPGIGPLSLVWFRLKIGEKEIDCVKENSNSRVQALMQDKPQLKPDSVLSQIARTPAFQPMSLYGHFKFTIEIRQVIQAYKTQFCKGFPYPEMRKLGTFAYKKEIMHVILVCPPNSPVIYECPELCGDPVIQLDKTLETWTWKPHSTGSQYVSLFASGKQWFTNIRWENVSFAFYIPNKSCLKINFLEYHVTLCLEKVRMREFVGVDEDIRMMLDLIASVEVTEKKSLADTLIRMIAGYLMEERLYEKTMEMGDYENQGYIRVNQELVVQRLQELLPPLKYEELDWSPLTPWMNSLTRHSNVLHVIQKASIRLCRQ